MALINKRMGARIFFSIGRRGEQPDVYPARIVSPITVTVGPKGPMETATIVTLQKNLEGEEYLGERVANLLYSWDRTEFVDALDGTPDEPKSVQEVVADRMAALAAHRASLAQSVSVDEIASA